MSYLANALMCRDVKIRPDAKVEQSNSSTPVASTTVQAYVPFVFNVNWWRFLTAYEFSFSLDPAHHGSLPSHRTMYDTEEPLPNPAYGCLTMSRVATNNHERKVASTFRLTQTSKTGALFEFLTTDDGLIKSPPICVTAIKHQPSAYKPIWVISGKKTAIFQTLFPNTEESGFGWSSWLADNVDVVIAPSAMHERFYTLTFVLKLFDSFECTRSEALNHHYIRCMVHDAPDAKGAASSVVPIEFPPDFFGEVPAATTTPARNKSTAIALQSNAK